MQLRSWGPPNPFLVKPRCREASLGETWGPSNPFRKKPRGCDQRSTGPINGCRCSICERLRGRTCPHQRSGRSRKEPR